MTWITGTDKLTSSLKVAIVDSKSISVGVKELPSTPDPRVSAITPSTVEFLKGLFLKSKI
jgi:hypothetical protein